MQNALNKLKKENQGCVIASPSNTFTLVGMQTSYLGENEYHRTKYQPRKSGKKTKDNVSHV